MSQDYYVDVMIPYTDGEFVETEVAQKIHAHVMKTPGYLTFEGDNQIWWMEVEPEDEEEGLFDTAMIELSLLFPDVLFRVDIYAEFSEVYRNFYYNGEAEFTQANVTIEYENSKWSI